VLAERLIRLEDATDALKIRHGRPGSAARSTRADDTNSHNFQLFCSPRFGRRPVHDLILVVHAFAPQILQASSLACDGYIAPKEP